MTEIIIGVVLSMLPVLWLVWVIAYNQGRSEGTLAERERWTRTFQGRMSDTEVKK